MKSTRDKLNSQRGSSAKDYMDTNSMIESKMNSDKDPVMDKLMEAGNIEEAGAVFSREGMKIFSSMFSNSIEQSIKKELEGFEDIVGKVVDQKLTEMMAGILKGLGAETSTEDSKTSETSQMPQSFITEAMMRKAPMLKKEPIERTVNESVKEEKPVKVQLREPSFEEAEKILENLVQEYKDEHGLIVKAGKKDLKRGAKLVEALLKTKTRGSKVLSKDIVRYFRSKEITFANMTMVINSMLDGTNISSGNILERVAFGTVVYSKAKFKSVL